jgi:hypothetical protein
VFVSGPVTIKQRLFDEIYKGIQIIRQLDDLTYRRHSDLSASVGEQFRHNLDFLNTFILGAAIGRIDYTQRERDAQVAASRAYAVERFEVALEKLAKLSRFGGMVSVRSEIDGATWLPSSIHREMEFVLSHTIHHHALIAEKLVREGIAVDSVVGVAPSTMEYRRRLAA